MIAELLLASINKMELELFPLQKEKRWSPQIIQLK
jgi:hypothetical protein